MNRRTFSFLACIALWLSLSLSAFAQQKVYVQKSATVPRGHIVTFPQGYQATGGSGYPLLIFLHGSGERGNQTTELTKVESTGLPQVMNGTKWDKTLPFIVVAPQLTSGDWWDSQVTEIYDYAVKNYNVDKNRVYYTGLSLGSMGTWTAVTVDSMAYKVAAFLPVSGKGSVWTALCPRVKNVGIWSFNGTTDSIFALSDAQSGIDSVNACSPTVPAKLTAMTGGHDASIWNTVYENGHGSSNIGADGKTYTNVYQWLLSFSLNASAPANVAPTANAGADKIIQLPTNSITLNGSGTDSDGTIGSYAWTKVSGGAATLAGASTANLSLSGLVQGSYTFRLTVADDKGAQGSDDVNVTVQAAAPANVAPTANAGADKIIQLPTNSITLNGSGTDSDGTIGSYAWTKVSGGAATLAGASTANLSLSGLVQGSYTFRLTVADDKGAQGSDDVNVTVQAALGASSPPEAPANFVCRSQPDQVTNVAVSGRTSTIVCQFDAARAGSGTSVTGYVLTCTRSDGAVQVQSASASPISLGAMQTGMSYNCTVIAQSNNGNSAAADYKIALQATPLSARSQADLSGQGYSMLILRTTGQSATSQPTLSGVWDGARFTFNPLIWDVNANTTLIGMGDATGSGKTGFVTRDGNAQVSVSTNLDSAAVVPTSTVLRGAKMDWSLHSTLDLDGDGNADMLWRYMLPGTNDSGVVFAWYMAKSAEGRPVVAEVKRRGGAPLDWALLGMIDLDSDGKADLVWQSPAKEIRALITTTNRNWVNQRIGATPDGYSPIKLGDFDGDANGDVLFKDENGRIKLWLMSGTTIKRDINLPMIGTDWSLYATGDFDGNGTTDIVWKRTDGSLIVWLMNKTTPETPNVRDNAGIAPGGYVVMAP